MSQRALPGAAMLRLNLIGPFRIADSANRPLPLRNRKAQALLALLALSPRGERTRVWLRDKLWSGSDERRSSTNLRQTIFEIRRDLGPLADRALEINAQSLALRPGRVWTDYEAVCADPAVFAGMGLSEESELLEGFDIGDPEFEDWLSIERMSWADRAEALAERARNLPPPEPLVPRLPVSDVPSQPVRTSLALLPSVLHGSDALGVHLSDRVMEGIANSLRELHPVRILDLRDMSGPIEDLVASATTEFYCRLRLLRIGSGVTLTLFLHRVDRMAIEWSQSIQCSMDDVIAYEGQTLQGFIAHSVDRLARTLTEALPARDRDTSMRTSGYAALNLIFRLDERALESALELLRPHDGAPSPLHSALTAYAASFQVGENIGRLAEDARELLRQTTASELDSSPFNSVALACFGHVLGYVFQEHDLAGSLLERAVALNPAQAFAWDHYALHKVYTGDFQTAREAALRAVALGAYSPISYSYETTLTMAATLAGDYDRAVMAGRSALQKQPRFNATKRYLMIAHAARGERDRAESLRDALIAADPDFVLPDVRETRYGRQVLQIAAPLAGNLRKLMDG